jgi:hypothetical protein
MIGLSPSFIPAAVALRHRATVRKFQAAGAVDAEHARTLDDLGVRQGHLLRRMVLSGVVATAAGQRYYLSAEGLARWRRRRRFAVLVAAGVVLIGALIALALAGP